MELELNEEARGLLTRVLTTYVADLRMEISATDSPSFKAGLRREEELLRELLDRLSAAAS
jgi:hypothetical protein